MQRLLFASTSAKDPKAPDTLYVSGLAAPFTVNTMPDSTLEAFADHGVVDAVLPAVDDDADREATVEQFREVVAAEAGVSQDDERLLRGVFSLGDTTVQDIMVPRVDVVAVRANDSWPAVVAQVRASAHSRYLVVGRDLDDAVGVLNAKDLLAGVLAGGEPPDGWRRLVRPAQFIPATKAVDDQLRDFKASQIGRAHV